MPKILPDFEYDRRKNASHDKKAWWSRPTALVKHLPDAFRASQQASQAAASQPISLVSNASRQNLARMSRRGRGFGSQADGPLPLPMPTTDSNMQPSIYYQMGSKRKMLAEKSNTERLVMST